MIRADATPVRSFIPNLVRWGALVLVGSSAVAGEAHVTPEAWLTRMEQALENRNYQGIFVHEHSGQAQKLRIVHRSAADSVAEHILLLDGTGREFIRHGNELVCYLPDQRTVLVDSSPGAGSLLAEFRSIDTASSGQYRVRELTPTRFSGREVRVIAVESRDRYRYGYRLWIDEKTSMPLKTQLRGARDEVIEQLWFTELSLPRQIADASFAPQTDASGYQWLRHEPTTPMASDLATAASAWQAADLPPGFQLTVRALQQLPGSSTPVTHLVFSDGLASVSVFVEQAATPAVVAATSSAGDMTRLGSSSAYSTVVSGYRVTAIGEVPADTVRAIASSTMNTQHARALRPQLGSARH
jgi:sigma-E factor negative regulatory protein RseB